MQNYFYINVLLRVSVNIFIYYRTQKIFFFKKSFSTMIDTKIYFLVFHYHLNK